MVSTVDRAPANPPYCASYGLESTSTLETTLNGRVISEMRETGSVTSMLLSCEPLWVARTPFMLISPARPLSTPGIRGITSSTLRFAFGALSSVEMPTEPDEVVSVGSIAITDAVTFTDSTTVSTSMAMSVRSASSSVGTHTMSLWPFNPAEVALRK